MTTFIKAVSRKVTAVAGRGCSCKLSLDDEFCSYGYGKCPDCGAELEDAGCYKVECPNDCFPVAMEEWWWDDKTDEKMEEVSWDGYTPHDKWELWHQDHSDSDFEYYLQCLGCGYQLAKKYWKDSDGTFVDYIDGIDEKAIIEEEARIFPDPE